MEKISLFYLILLYWSDIKNKYIYYIDNMSQIFNNLWITCGGTAREFDFLRENEITHILNCAEEESINYPKDITAIHILMTDDDDDSGMSQIIEGAQILGAWMNAGVNTIVHCKAGISRSVTVVLAWMIMYKEYTFNDAYKFVQDKRNFINPNDYYRKLLRIIEETFHTGEYKK
jgi:protein-tyrosine phosphatase